MADAPRSLAPVLERFRSLRLYDRQIEERRYAVAPALAEAEWDVLREGLGADLPEDLRQVGDATCGIRGPGIDFDLVPTVDDDEGTLREDEALGRCLVLGGDGWGSFWKLHPHEGRCLIWWDGQEPSHLVLAARSLVEFLERRLEHADKLREVADQARRGVELPEPAEPDARPALVEGRPAAELGGCEPEGPLRDLLLGSPPGSVAFDLRGLPTPVGVDRDALFGGGPASGQLRCHGEIVVFVPEQPEDRARREAEFQRQLEGHERWLRDFERRERPWWKFW